MGASNEFFIQSNPIQSNPIQSNPIQSNPIQSNPIQSNPIQSNMIKYCFIFLLCFCGQVAIACEKPPVHGYQDVDCLREGLAGVKKGGLWGFVNTTGKVVIDVQYDEVGPFDKGIAIVNHGGKIMMINTLGEKVISKNPNSNSRSLRENTTSLTQ